MTAATKRWPQYARVLVCGSRALSGLAVRRTIEGVLRQFSAKLVINGAALGVDTEATAAAGDLGLPVGAFPADWERHGKAAGPLRNAEMLAVAEPDLVVAVHDDWRLGKGTRDMVRKALAANLPVYFVWLGKHGQCSAKFIEELPR